MGLGRLPARMDQWKRRHFVVFCSIYNIIPVADFLWRWFQS